MSCVQGLSITPIPSDDGTNRTIYTLSISVAVTPTATPSAIPKPMAKPGEPPRSLRILQDNDSSPYIKAKSINSGDNPLNDLYERPFTAREMIYQPDADIISVDVARDEIFYYFTIHLQGLEPKSQSLTGSYAIEFDRTLTGRGDLLVTATRPGPDWSTDNVNILLDKNKDVGGPKPIVADRGFKGDGYESRQTMSGDLSAFARLEPGNSTALQIAVNRKVIGLQEKFLWGAWASKSELNPDWFDLDDHFGKSEAGSPIRSSPDYPLKALHSLDNTCRLNFGFFPSGFVPGMCIFGPIPSHPGEACSCIQSDSLSGVCYKWYCK